MERNEVFLCCLRRYKQAYDRMILNEKQRTRNRIEGEADGILDLSADIFGLTADVVKGYFNRCTISWDGEKDVILVPQDVFDAISLTEYSDKEVS